MRDGVRLAATVHLPVEATPGPVPTILHQTRYYRAVAMRRAFAWIPLGPAMDTDWETRKRFLAAGYAWVDVCVRGSGASFGSRPSPWSDDEVGDGPQIVDWIVAQPWSDGQVGATGISYAGTAAELLASARHPAVRAVAPRFSCFDVYPDVAFPGGLHLDWFTSAWGQFNNLLDNNQLADALALNLHHTARACQGLGARFLPLKLAGHPLVQRLLKAVVGAIARGVAPVDDDTSGRVLAEAVGGHSINYDVHAGASRVRHRDDPGLSEALPQARIDHFSPHARLDSLRESGVPVLSYSGWLDGGYAGSAVKRHRGLGPGQSRLVLGPWNHGGGQDISPFRPPGPAREDHVAALLDFFNEHMRGQGDSAEPIRYFTLGQERWKTAASWPPPTVASVPYYLGPLRTLSVKTPTGTGVDTYQVDAALGTGARGRWNSLLGLRAPIGYGDMSARCERMLSFTAAPLVAPLEVTGSPVFHLRISADQPDAALFGYLMDVAPDGRVTLVSEGQLRAIHRGPDGRFGAPGTDPHHSFMAADAHELPLGAVCSLSFGMLPVSYRYSEGHAVRVAISGADRDHFRAAIDAPTTLDFLWGGVDPPRLDLPVVRS